MNVSVTDIGPAQKRLRVEVPASRVREEMEGKYRELAKKVKIKGFRPGKVPRSIIKSYYGKVVEQELSSHFIQETFPDALKETDLKPLTQADVGESHFEDDGSFSYTALVDICPPFELPDYKGLKLYKSPIEVSEEQVQAELERLRQGHAQLRSIEEERLIVQGDVAVVDFTPSVDGKVYEKGKTRDFMVEVGKGSMHPDFDRQLIGRRAGENFSFELDYAEDAPTPEIAGKRVHFDLVVKEVKEKEVPELNDEFAQALGTSQFETLDDLIKEIREQIMKREEEKLSSMLGEQITEKLLKQAQFEVSPKVIENEADRMVENLKYQFERQGLSFDSARFNAPEYRSGYLLQAERNVRARIVLDRIADAEKITLSDEENEEVYREIGKVYGVEPAKVEREFADSALVEQARDRRREDKVLNLIKDGAVYVETPEEAKDEEAKDEEAGGTESAGAGEDKSSEKE